MLVEHSGRRQGRGNPLLRSRHIAARRGISNAAATTEAADVHLILVLVIDEVVNDVLDSPPVKTKPRMAQSLSLWRLHSLLLLRCYAGGGHQYIGEPGDYGPVALNSVRSMTVQFNSSGRIPTHQNRERKRLLAHIIDHVTLVKLPTEGTTKVHVRSKGRKIQTPTTQSPKSSAQQVKIQPGIVELLDKLLDDHVYSEIAPFRGD
ncbi:hypothetical protein [Mesorhizobium sp. M0968]|uniref:hypothetical protein n=1 Tax=Mesorhizobium sp. M0968 TaxID=2957037 RepID=UPI0033397F11